MSKRDDGLRIEYTPLDEVVRWPRNPRQHDDAALERSLQRYGFVAPLLYDDHTSKLIAGHGRLGALVSLRDAGENPPARVKVDGKGRWLVPVVRGITFTTASEAEAYLVADNRLAEIGGWDQDLLREIVRDLDAEGWELDTLGWSEAALDRLLEDTPAPPPPPKASVPTAPKLDSLAPEQTRLIPVYVEASAYQPTVDRMRAIMDQHRLPDYTALLLFLLDHHDATAPRRSTAGDPFGGVA